MPGTPSGNCREDDDPFLDEPFDPRTLLVDDPGDFDEPWPGYPFSPDNAPPDEDDVLLRECRGPGGRRGDPGRVRAP